MPKSTAAKPDEKTAGKLFAPDVAEEDSDHEQLDTELEEAEAVDQTEDEAEDQGDIDPETLVLAIGPGNRVVREDTGELYGTVKRTASKQLGQLELTIDLPGVLSLRRWIAGLVCGPEARPEPSQMDLPGTLKDEELGTEAIAEDPEAERVYEEAVAQAADD